MAYRSRPGMTAPWSALLTTAAFVWAAGSALAQTPPPAGSDPGTAPPPPPGQPATAPPPAASVHRSGLPPAIDAVIAKGMAKVPADRYRAAGDFARALARALTEPAASPPPPAATVPLPSTAGMQTVPLARPPTTPPPPPPNRRPSNPTAPRRATPRCCPAEPDSR